MLMLLTAISLRILRGRYDGESSVLVIAMFGIVDAFLVFGVWAVHGEQILSMVGG